MEMREVKEGRSFWGTTTNLGLGERGGKHIELATSPRPEPGVRIPVQNHMSEVRDLKNIPSLSMGILFFLFLPAPSSGKWTLIGW